MKPVTRSDSNNIYGPSANTLKKAKPPDFKLAQTDTLLKETHQYQKWKNLCQNNDKNAEKVADYILKRHKMLEKAKKGNPVDLKTFNELTKKIENYGILLFDSSQMKKAGYIWAKNIKETSLPTKKELYVNPKISGAVNRSVVKHSIKNIPARLPRDEELILEVKYNNHLISQGILAQSREGEIYYPIKSIAGVLNTELKKDASGHYSGKTYDGKDVYFNIGEAKVSKEGDNLRFDTKDFIKKDGEDYISSKVFNEIYGSNLKLNFSEMNLDLETDKNFPVTDKIKRSKRHVFSGFRNFSTVDYPAIDQTYSLYRTPVMDFQTNIGWNKEEDDNPDYDYSLKASGELLKSGVNLYVQGNEDDNPDRVEFTAERVNPEKNSPFDITRFAVGDIRHRGFSVFGTGNTEKGIRIESKNILRTNDFDSTDFNGNLPEGWDIELYRGNVLIGKQNSSENGRFEFDDVPLFYGDNRFKLVYYGPFGERKEEEKIITIDSAMERPGELSYDFSLSKKEEDTFSFKDELHPKDYGSAKVSSTFSTGINNNLSIQGGIKSEEIKEKRHNYLSLGFKGSLSGILFNNDYAISHSGGEATGFSAQTRIKDINVRLKETLYNDFIKDSTNISDKEKSVSQLSLSGILFEKSRFPVSWSMDEKYIAREYSFSNILDLRQGYSNGDFSIYNSNTWNNDSLQNRNELRGNLHFHKKTDKDKISFYSDYEVSPDTKIRNASVTHERPINEEINSNIGISHNFDQSVTNLKASLGYDNGKLKVSPSFSVDTQGDWKIYASMGLSAGQDPNTNKFNTDSSIRSHYGEISALAYNDANHNGRRDMGEEALSGIRLESEETGLYSYTDEKGIASIRGLTTNRKHNIRVNEDYIEDPFLVSSKEGVSFYPRSGRIEKVEFPLFRSAEISGNVYSFNENGEKQILPYEKINIVSKDGKIKKEIYSEFDGYYSLDRLPPGEYQLESGTGGDVYEYRENINIKPSDSDLKNIIIVKREAEQETESRLNKPIYSKLLFGKDTDHDQPVNMRIPFNKFPDRTILLYEGGKWLFGNEDIEGYGIHIASFDNIDTAKKYIEDTGKKLDEKIVIKRKPAQKKDWYRVLCGNYEKRDHAKESMDRIYAVTGYTSILNYS